MSDRHWMPFYIGDYLRDTRRLSTLEHGAYLLLIMEYWTYGGLPNDNRKLARIAGLSESEWSGVRDNLAELFQPKWKHKRIDAELAKAKERSDIARAKANKKWRMRADAAAHATADATADATASRQHVPGICPEDASHNHSHNHSYKPPSIEAVPQILGSFDKVEPTEISTLRSATQARQFGVIGGGK